MNSSLFTSLNSWARRAVGRVTEQAEAPAAAEFEATSYRLRAWPELHDLQRVAPIYRLLSVMTVRPVSRAWMIEQSRLPAAQVDALLAQLEAGGELVTVAPVAAERLAPAPQARPARAVRATAPAAGDDGLLLV